MTSLLSRLAGRGVLPIGVDIGAAGARLVQFRRDGGRLAVLAAARAELGESGAAALPPDDPTLAARLAELAAHRVESDGFRGRRCVLSIDHRLLRVRSIRLPRLGDDELDKAVRLDAPSRLGFTDEEECEIGWVRAGEVLQGNEPRDEVIVAGVLRAPVERLVYAFAERGLRPIAVEPGFIAEGRAFSRTLRRAADRDTTRLIVDIGWKTTNVIVIRGTSIAFHKPLEIGGELMNRKAAERLNLEPATIAELRRRRMTAGAEVDPRVDRAIYESVRPVLGDLAQEVALCQRYYSVTFRGSRAEACLLAGGEAREPHLVEMLSEALRVPVRPGLPFEGLKLPPGAESLEEDPAWGVAAGLSLRTAFIDPPAARRGRVAASHAEIRAGDSDASPAARREAA